MSPRYSRITREEIQYSYWLTFGDDGTVSLSRGEPRTGRGEVAMSCVCTLPQSLFKKPTLAASITVDPGSPKPFSVNVQAANEALKHALGVDIDLQVRGSSE